MAPPTVLAAGVENPFPLSVESGSAAITSPPRSDDHCNMNDSDTDDYGEWLRLAQEALGTLAHGQLLSADR
jgi:hypothetical protein